LPAGHDLSFLPGFGFAALDNVGVFVDLLELVAHLFVNTVG